MKNKIKTIVFDIESSPLLGYFWGRNYETNIIKILEYDTIICLSYWDSETGKVKNIAQWDYKDWKKGVWNDKSLIKDFRDIVIKYDIIAGQNSDQFDIKMVNARLAFHGLEPLPETKTLDTKKIAKSKLKLPSYSLEVMANFFGLEGKYHHSGLDMWFKCKDGDISAQKEMVHYCNIDVIKTKDVLYKLLPFVKQFNDFQPKHDIGIVCSNPLCRSDRLIKAKRRYTVGGVKQQYQCNDCHRYTQGKDFID
jgi:DNA polymerase elongation subunit (family B)